MKTVKFFERAKLVIDGQEYPSFRCAFGDYRKRGGTRGFDCFFYRLRCGYDTWAKLLAASPKGRGGMAEAFAARKAKQQQEAADAIAIVQARRDEIALQQAALDEEEDEGVA